MLYERSSNCIETLIDYGGTYNHVAKVASTTTEKHSLMQVLQGHLQTYTHHTVHLHLTFTVTVSHSCTQALEFAMTAWHTDC